MSSKDRHITKDIHALLEQFDIAKPSCGADVGPGWIPLIESLIIDLIALGWDKQVDQIKEKYGGLRFYTGQASKEIDLRIHEAEMQSMTICEACGAPGVIRDTGWLTVLCDECVARETRERNLRRERNSE